MIIYAQHEWDRFNEFKYSITVKLFIIVFMFFYFSIALARALSFLFSVPVAFCEVYLFILSVDLLLLCCHCFVDVCLKFLLFNCFVCHIILIRTKKYLAQLSSKLARVTYKQKSNKAQKEFHKRRQFVVENNFNKTFHWIRRIKEGDSTVLRSHD